MHKVTEFPLLFSDNTTATSQSGKPRRFLKELMTLMSQVRSNFGAQELTPETAAMWLDAWCALAEKYGLELVKAALIRHCRTQRFLPLPVDVEDGIDAVIAERKAAIAPSTKFEHCTNCVDGWLVRNR